MTSLVVALQNSAKAPIETQNLICEVLAEHLYIKQTSQTP